MPNMKRPCRHTDKPEMVDNGGGKQLSDNHKKQHIGNAEFGRKKNCGKYKARSQ